MSYITLENIRIYAYHGCLEEETKIGSDYRVDLRVSADLSVAARTDQLEDTVDYVALQRIVREEMAIPSKLLEHVAQRIMDRIFLQLSAVDAVHITVAKCNPPIGGDVAAVSVCLNGKRG